MTIFSDEGVGGNGESSLIADVNDGFEFGFVNTEPTFTIFFADGSDELLLFEDFSFDMGGVICVLD